MKYIITTILFLIALTTSAQVRDKQLKVDSTTSRPRPVSTPRVYIMASDTSAGALYNTGKWVDRDSLGLGGGGCINVYTFGIVPDGTDQTDRIYTLLNHIDSIGGGCIQFNEGTYRIDSLIRMPNDGGARPLQPPLRILGTSPFKNGNPGSFAPDGGTIFDLRHSSGAGRIITNGDGFLGLENITFMSSNASASVPFILTTNTTINVRNCGFYGRNSGLSADETAIQMGAQSVSGTVDDSDSSPFQGYGSLIENNWFNRVERGVYGGTYANNIVIKDNTWWSQCGGVAAIEFNDVFPIQDAVGNVISGNLIEMGGYDYGFKFQSSSNNSIMYNSFYDHGGGVITNVFFDTFAVTNLLIEGFSGSFSPTNIDDSESATIITPEQGVQSRFRQGLIVHDGADLWNSVARTWLVHHPSNGRYFYQIMEGLGVKTMFNDAGDLALYKGERSGSASLFSLLGGDNNKFAFTDGGVHITSSTGSPEGVKTAPVGSTYHRSDGGAGTSYYVKESGTGNTGWVLISTASTGGDDWGADVVNTDLTLTGDGTIGNVLKVDTSEIATQYDLTLISGAGDDWGADVVNTDLTLTGDGTAGNVLKVDTSEIATQFDISGLMDNWLLAASGTGGTESISDNETATITGAGINVATRSGANVTVTGTEVDGSITNEIQDITLTGSNPYVLDLSDDATDVTFAGAGIVTLSEGVANTLTITGTEVDGSVTNEAWTIDGDAGDTEVISNQTVLFDGTGIVSTTYTASSNTLTIAATEVDGSTTNELNTIEEGNVSVQTGNTNIDFQTMFDVAVEIAGEVNVSLDLSEATTVTSAESDDYIILYDNGSSQHQKILWPDILTELIEFKDGNSTVGTGSIIDVGEGLDINMSPTDEANINLDASEFQIDGTTEGVEYVLIHDADTTSGHQIQRRLVSSFGGADGNGIYDGDGTTPADTDVGITDYIDFDAGTFVVDGTGNMVGIGTVTPDYLLDIESNSANVHIKDLNGGSGGQISIESVQETGIVAGISFQYTDSDYSGGTLQQTHQITAERQTDDKLHSIITIDAQDGTDTDVFSAEKNEDFSNSTNESSVLINAGIRFSQYIEQSTSGDLDMDRSFYHLNITGGAITDTIKLPEVITASDNWTSITSTQCGTGQEYVVTNARSAINLVISAYNPGGSGSDDLIGTRTQPGGSAGSAISIAPGKSAIIKCYGFTSNIGYWNYWLSN